ncbi:MAG: Hsp20/alpha crystallin family protein [Thermoanaerobaculia bacterium]
MTKNAVTRREATPSAPAMRDPFFGPFFDRFFNADPFRFPLMPTLGEEMSTRNWVPAVDIKETDEAFVIHAELPGLTKEDISITLENNVLRLAGERKFEKEMDKDNYHRIERAYGSFNRAFSLGTGVVAEKVNAQFKDGILTVTVPKAEETKPRKIAIF